MLMAAERRLQAAATNSVWCPFLILRPNLFALPPEIPYCHPIQLMNAKLLFKMLLLIAILLLLVIIGMNNPQSVRLRLPPALGKARALDAPAALMYFGFFAVGLLTGTILTAGKKGGGSSRAKADK